MISRSSTPWKPISSSRCGSPCSKGRVWFIQSVHHKVGVISGGHHRRQYGGVIQDVENIRDRFLRRRQQLKNVLLRQATCAWRPVGSRGVDGVRGEEGLANDDAHDQVRELGICGVHLQIHRGVPEDQRDYMNLYCVIVIMSSILQRSFKIRKSSKKPNMEDTEEDRR